MLLFDRLILLASQERKLSQEELTAYEVGTKIAMLDRKLQLDAAAFYYDYRDKQFFTFVPVPFVGTSSTFVNIPKSKVKGAEADVTFRPVDSLTMHGGITYIKTQIGQFSGFTSGGVPVDFTGKEFNFSPPISASFDAEYLQPVGDDLNGYVGFGGVANSRTFADLGESARTRLPAYVTLDARLGVRSGKGWRAGVFVRNLTDKYYWTSIAYAGDTLVQFAGMPRTFGGMFSIDF